MTDYYKSLISDEEVIAALVKDSKSRENGQINARLRPNLNFFQRTVSNMVSVNRRLKNEQRHRAKEEYSDYLKRAIRSSPEPSKSQVIDLCNSDSNTDKSDSIVSVSSSRELRHSSSSSDSNSSNESSRSDNYRKKRKKDHFKRQKESQDKVIVLSSSDEEDSNEYKRRKHKKKKRR